MRAHRHVICEVAALPDGPVGELDGAPAGAVRAVKAAVNAVKAAGSGIAGTSTRWRGRRHSPLRRLTPDHTAALLPTTVHAAQAASPVKALEQSLLLADVKALTQTLATAGSASAAGVSRSSRHRLHVCRNHLLRRGLLCGLLCGRLLRLLGLLLLSRLRLRDLQQAAGTYEGLGFEGSNASGTVRDGWQSLYYWISMMIRIPYFGTQDMY